MCLPKGAKLRLHLPRDLHVVKGGGAGGFGGGSLKSLKHPRQWLGTQWVGLSPAELSC